MGTTDCTDAESLGVDAPANVLLLAPSMSSGARNACPNDSNVDEQNLLLVSLDGNPDRRLDVWRRNCGLPSTVGVVTWDESRGAAGVASSSGTSSLPTPGNETISVTTVAGPDDLTGIGMKVSQCLSAWADAPERTAMCFDSVTTLLQYTDVQQAFRFLDVLTSRISAVDGIAQYHMDPAALDDETVERIKGLFSHVFRFDTETGEWRPV